MGMAEHNRFIAPGQGQLIKPPGKPLVVKGLGHQCRGKAAGQYMFQVGKGPAVTPDNAGPHGPCVDHFKQLTNKGQTMDMAQVATFQGRNNPGGVAGFNLFEPVVVLGENLFRGGLINGLPMGGFGNNPKGLFVAPVGKSDHHKTGGLIVFLSNSPSKANISSS
jgi:hypothetical protein